MALLEFPSARNIIGALRQCSKMALTTLPVLIVLQIADLLSLAEAQTLAPTTASLLSTTPNTSDTSFVCDRKASDCKEGLLLPMWKPQGNLSNGDKAARAVVYMVSMIYMFLGVSIVADRFMASIEVITSKEKEVVVKRPDGSRTVVNVRIWNETVSNLTLMALGSSAPEILLSVIEICGNKFTAGDLGPSTIVGSAAFNLFVIIAICVYCIPSDEVRRIKHLRVFFITASWSIFAYLWLFIIVAVSSPGQVKSWEAILTLLFFPLTVGTAYIADRRLLVYKFMSKKYTASSHKGVMVASEGLHETEMADGKSNQLTEEVIYKGIDSQNTEIAEFEQHRRDFIEIMRELRQKNPNIDMKTLEEMAEYEAVNRGPKSRAFYRIQATRKLTGGGKVIKKAKIERRASVSEVKVDEEEVSKITQVYFDPGHYTVMENVGTFSVTVTREGGDLSKTCYVDYRTEDGTAQAGTDYLDSHGTLCFQPNEKHKQFEVSILDDDLFEEDEHFYVHLANVRIGDSNGMFEDNNGQVELATPFMATVMILDDDHPGIFHFEDKEMTITENIGEVMVKVCRASGARGTVRVPYHAVDGSAKAGKDYETVSGEIFFENDEAE